MLFHSTLQALASHPRHQKPESSIDTIYSMSKKANGKQGLFTGLLWITQIIINYKLHSRWLTMMNNSESIAIDHEKKYRDR